MKSEALTQVEKNHRSKPPTGTARTGVGDFVKAEKAGQIICGYIGGYTEKSKVVSVYDWQWKRIGKFSINKTTMLRRSNGLCVA